MSFLLMPLLGYGLQYTMPFRSRPIDNREDPRGQLWRVQFSRKNYGGAVTELKAGDVPWQEETPDLLFDLMPKRMTIVVVSTPLIVLASFFTNADRVTVHELLYN